MTRADGRTNDELRPITITRNWLDHAAGSVLVEFGKTRVLCAASRHEGVPRWRKGSGLGWVTAEYAMLPASTNTRSDRESVKGRIGGRTHEISRLVGRSLRAIIDYKALGENTIVLDCDVLQADGGTRTAAITGAYVALADAVAHLQGIGALKGEPLTGSVAAISVGIIDGEPRLDLPYEEDVRAETDMNVVMTGDGAFVEVQGTAEGAPFDRAMLDSLLALAEKGCADLTAMQLRGARRMSPRSSSRPATPRSCVEMRRILVECVPDVRCSVSTTSRRTTSRRRPRPTFEGNALLKAHAGRRRPPGCRRSPTTAGCASTRSTACRACCRRAGRASRRTTPANNRLLLEQLADVPDERRGAHFTCAVAFAYPVGAAGVAEHVVHGEMPGRVIREMRGSGGFGYDVLFVADGDDDRTSAELSVEEKDAISHRGKALREIAPGGRRRARPAAAELVRCAR